MLRFRLIGYSLGPFLKFFRHIYWFSWFFVGVSSQQNPSPAPNDAVEAPQRPTSEALGGDTSARGWNWRWVKTDLTGTRTLFLVVFGNDYPPFVVFLEG